MHILTLNITKTKMKNIILSLLMLISISAFSKTLVNTYKCDHIIVKFYDDNTCEVGGLNYEIQLQTSIDNNKNVFYFIIDDKPFLLGHYDKEGDLVILNTDNPNDSRKFIKCKKEKNKLILFFMNFIHLK